MGALVGDVHKLQTLTIHTSDVNSIDFASGHILVTASGDKKVRIWDWKSGTGYVETPFSPLLGHKYGVTCVKISPQSTMVASSSIDGTTQLWNLRTGAKIHTMVQVGGEAVRVCKFSPDSSVLITAGDNGQLCVWDLVRRTLIRCFQKHEGAIQGSSFSPDSLWLITSCTFGVLNLFSTNEIIDSCPTSNRELNLYATVDDAHDLGVVCCEFSNREEITGNEPLSKLYQLVTCGNDHSVKLWEVRVAESKCNTANSVASINLCRVLEKHSSALTCVRLSSNGMYTASCGLDKTTIIWETDTGKIVSVLKGHNRYVACCAFSKDGTLLATGSNDKSIIIWDLTGNLTVDSEIGHGARLVQYSENDESESEVVKHAETSSNEVKVICCIDDNTGSVNGVSVFKNNLIASGSGDRNVRIWDIVHENEDDEQEITLLEKSFSPLRGHKYTIHHLEFSPCGTMLASSSLDGTTIIWDTEVTNGEQARGSFISSGSGIRVCRWSPDGKMIATAGDDEKTTLWDVDAMEELKVFGGQAEAVTAVAFTPDSKYLVTGCNEGTWAFYDIECDDPASALLMFCKDGHDLGVQGCDISPTTGIFTASGTFTTNTNGDNLSYLLATGGNDSYVKLWRIDIINENHDEPRGSSDYGYSYKLRKQLAGHGGNVMDVRFSLIQGEILGSVATDKTARLWSVYTGVCLHVLENHRGLITSCAFSEDSTLFVTGGLDKRLLVWKLPEQLVSQSMLINRLRNSTKRVTEWSVNEISKWLMEIGLPNIIKHIHMTSITGRHLLHIPEDEIIHKLGIKEDEETMGNLKKQLFWLKRENSNNVGPIDEADIPHEFFCPITHEIMKEPVQCSDGYTYERAAINEWFLCGKFTSPMTNEPLHDKSFSPNIELRNAIYTLLHGEGP
ncbi:WD repeat, SAM and U-box domain-containing protein 1-like isoform X1 [Leptopilina heterotoma]|uniref:WD repeat, SAM and U-box domain-containing protein 1-like isoform X1 n=1 Tax=Leptopilina heterotoma TaxID=63436 RepID=UPI001CA843B8|nr:WD repeat, SAM and U-box domain-containing protein 1-like isoform X1 [Leptopilina heterotoma]XP_043472468.1 WD repeat, SAM and U-box domain-containing protein 1-like isoform X1 [Leptopilina heterotoma]XP_043472469.1 WD repeat, SAM and U-box domain-containing protein 1-like isoform X1 [Leptopilina heterotoma]